MTTEALPEFRYHPDPVATGSVVESSAPCVACNSERGFVYTGPVYSSHIDDEKLCPWCIADGSAADRFEAEFTGVDSVPRDVDRDVIDEIVSRTPGFAGWQQEQWMFHCGDGAAFLGAAGARELEPHPDAIDMLLHEHEELGWPATRSAAYVQSLDRNGQPTAYLFRCRHCGAHVAYSDFT